MRKIFFFTVLGIIFFLNIQGQNFVEIDKSNSGQSIQIAQNQVLEVNLPRISSTGYVWCESINSSDKAQQSITQIGDGDFVHDAGTLKGRKGTQIIRYVGTSQGTTDLTLELRRPWEKNKSAIDNFTVTIVSSGKYTGNYTPPVKEKPKHITSNTKSASRWDWRSQCTPITDQMYCGDCWAFAAVATLECNILIHDTITRDISEEYLTDCDVAQNGCNGGNCPHDYWLAPKGAVYESEDPWTTSEGNGNTGTCGGPYVYHETINSYADVVGQTAANNYIPADADMKNAIYNYGPIWVGIDASSTAWSNYSGGIWTEASSATYSDHAVALVGWCDSAAVSGGGYWILRNSWGTGWGINGYMYISYGSDIVGQGADYIVYKGGIPHAVPPVADFGAISTSSCTGGPIQFTDFSTNVPTSWHWDFGDGDTSNVQNPSHTYTSNGTYTVSLISTNGYGVDSLTMANYITINMPAAPLVTNATICDSGSTTLNASGSGIIGWYNLSTGGVVFNTGTSYITPVLNTTTTYYVNNEVTSSPVYGAKPNNSGGGGYLSYPQWYLTFDCYTALTLVSVDIYVDTVSYPRTIQLRNSAGTVLDSVTITNFTSGLNTIPLNFSIPVGTNLQLGLSYYSLADLYRNNSGVSYPYTSAGLFSITGSNADASHYYYFYNWKVQNPPCISARAPITATILQSTVANFTDIITNDTVNFTNTSSNAISYLWNFGDGDTSTKANPSHTYTSNGVYTVTLIATNICSQDTAIKSFNVINTEIERLTSDDYFEVYPNPSNGIFDLKVLSVDSKEIQINIFNIQGKKIYCDNFISDKKGNSKTINLSNFEKGVYYLEIISGSQIKNKIIILQ